ncbi:hypothetical protein VTJ83DRAFT_3064 [Remersonia thermophila]|uniref:N-alpha-acetyltransferase 40 n=1 Tax=Remersonia thermophila TaxID=72144 RepID=A0ABR4DCZ5_9PEZI
MKPPPCAIELANRKPDEQFIADYLLPQDTRWTTSWTHPLTNAEHTISLVGQPRLSEADLAACFRLIEETSRKDYEASSAKWRPRKKLDEMRSPDLRYILVKEKETGAVRGFTSLMPTYEEGEPVIYCYEIHLHSELQGTGLGKLLMSFHTTIAQHLPPINKVMLTCFLSNARGLAFYRKLGFDKDDISPEPRVLRGGKTREPDYVILSKLVR